MKNESVLEVTANTDKCNSIFGIHVELQPYVNKIKGLLYKIRAFQVNLLTSPFYHASYTNPQLVKPSEPDITKVWHRQVTWYELIDIVDSKIKKKIIKKVFEKYDIETAIYKIDMENYKVLKGEKKCK